MSDSANFQQALAKWRAILGSDFCLHAESLPTHYTANTVSGLAAVLAALLPKNREELTQVVQIAAEFGVPLYPISRGRNIGYGSKAPPTPGQVILDLSRLNQILEVNEELGYAVVEPGVTPAQLFDHIQHKNLNLQLDVSGAPADSSLLGNILERGYGMGRLSDHYLHSAGFEVLLSDGTSLPCGLSQFKQARAKHLYKWGLGPSLDGLFTQSNFGIVTQGAVMLEPKTLSFTLVNITWKDETSFLASIPILRKLRQSGALSESLHIYDELRAVASFINSPTKNQANNRSFSISTRASLAREFGFGAWNGVVSIGGDKRLARAKSSILKQALKPHAKIRAYPSALLLTARKFPKLAQMFGGKHINVKLASIQPFFGEPSSLPLRLAYWRQSLPNATHVDPDLDSCGLIWISPVLPATPSCAEEVIAITKRICKAHDIDVNIALNFINDRCLSGIIAILFDQAHSAERARARSCAIELTQALIDQGYPPYRLPAPLMQEFIQKNEFWDICAKLKQALDPKGIIAPGRYSY